MATREGFEVTSSSSSTPEIGRADVTTAGSSGEIRDDIRRTRAEMDQTVDALSEKLRPRHLLDDMLDMFRSKAGNSDAEVTQTAKDYGSAIVDRLKSNPIPAALIGAGVAWMIFDQTRDGGSSGNRGNGNGPYGRWRDEDLREYSGSFVDARTGQPYDESYGAEFRNRGGGSGASSTGGGGDVSSAGGGSGGPGIMDKLKDKAGQVGESISDAASSVAGSVRNLASGASSSASHLGGRASDMSGRASEWSSSAYNSAGQGMRRGYDTTRRSFEDALDRYPLAMGAAALAAGVLTGLLLPETRRENELMGEQSDRLKEGAKETAQDLMDRGKQVAGNAANTAAEAAQRQGAGPSDIVDKLKHVARDVTDAARESARREGLTDLGQQAKAVVNETKEAAKEETRRHKDELRG